MEESLALEARLLLDRKELVSNMSDEKRGKTVLSFFLAFVFTCIPRGYLPGYKRTMCVVAIVLFTERSRWRVRKGERRSAR